MTLTTEATVPPARSTPATGVRATARITAVTTGGTTTLPVLDGDGPFELRRLRSRGTEARVCIVGAMSAPLGGDRLRIEATAQQGAALHISSAAATLALAGPTSEHATYDVHLTVAEHAELRWLPKPLICAAGSNLRQTWTVDLDPTARLLLREEQVLGRIGRRPAVWPPDSPSDAAGTHFLIRELSTAQAPPVGTAPPSSPATARPGKSSSSTQPSKESSQKSNSSATIRKWAKPS